MSTQNCPLPSSTKFVAWMRCGCRMLKLPAGSMSTEPIFGQLKIDALGPLHDNDLVYDLLDAVNKAAHGNGIGWPLFGLSLQG